MRTITKIQVLSAYKIGLTFSNGKSVQIDFSKKIELNTATSPLADAAFFKRVKITRGGRAIEWPGEIDFCADALWLEGSREENPYIEKQKAS
jgi:hypothetical protein